MPNYCSYELIAKGDKKDLEELVALLNENYNYLKTDDDYCLFNPETEDERKLINIANDIIKNINGQKEKGDDILYKNLVKQTNNTLKNSEKYEKIANYFKSLIDLEIDNNYPIKEQKPHLFRVFDADANWYDNDNEVAILGYCAWSVSSCMLEGEYSYYNDWKNETPPKNFNGTTLNAFCKEHPNIEIEIISDETGCAFTEHYYFKDGTLKLEECDEIKSDDNENYSSDANYVDIETDDDMPLLEYNFEYL